MIDLMLYVITVGKIAVNLAEAGNPRLAPNISAYTAAKTREKKGGNLVDSENRLSKQEWHREADARSMGLAQMC